MHKQVLVLIISVTVSCCAGASKVVAAAAASAANTATAIATYQILRSMGAQPQIQATPYGMVTTSEGKQHRKR